MVVQVVYGVALNASLVDARCCTKRKRHRFSRRKFKKRRSWLVALSNAFAMVVAFTILAAMDWASLPSSGKTPLADSPFAEVLFWLSHLTPPIYALPYLLRAVALVAAYDPRLRIRFRWFTTPW